MTAINTLALGQRVYERGAVSAGEGVVIALSDSRVKVRWDNGAVQWLALDSLELDQPQPTEVIAE